MNLQQVVHKKYKERFRETQESIINGVRDWPEYRYQIGYLKGMWDLMEDIDPLLQDPDSINDAGTE